MAGRFPRRREDPAHAQRRFGRFAGLAASFAPDGQSVYALGNHGGDTARLWRLAGGTSTAVSREGQVLEAFALSADGKTIAAVVDLGATSRLELLDASGKPRATPTLPPGVISDLQWHPSRNDVAFNLAGARTFSDVYSVDAATGRAEQWTRSEMAAAAPEALPDAEIVRWSSFDGVEISGVLYRPAARFTGPRPVIINVHGGPVARERPRNIGRSNYFRNELGIAVIYPNIRGSAGFGRAFEELDNGRLRENAVKDIGALLDWIAAQPGLDKSRVMIAGPSYGGFVALASAIAYPDRLRGVNPAFGITDFPSFLESTDVARQANRNAEYRGSRGPRDAVVPGAHLAADERREDQDAGLHRRRRQGHAGADRPGGDDGEGAEEHRHAGVVRALRERGPRGADAGDQRLQHLHLGHVRAPVPAALIERRPALVHALGAEQHDRVSRLRMLQRLRHRVRPACRTR